MHCIVLTRNGLGDAWKFKDLRAARLHPIAQMDDVFASTPSQLAELYGRGRINDLLRFADGRNRVRLVEAIENWPLTVDAMQLLWTVVAGAAGTPPTDPTEIVRIIKEDRVFREGRILRSFDTGTRSSAEHVTNRKERAMAEEARKRIDENSIITVTTEDGKNPKREGSAAYARFELYEDGMTVKEAKEAGVTAVDIAYDSAPERGYISLRPGVVADNEDDDEESKPAKKSRKKKAA
jgi:hypothetical protein